MKIKAMALLVVVASMSQLAEAADPIVRQGSRCPVGYMKAGDYCKPFRSTEKRAIERSGSNCPIGWYKSGKYCVKRASK